MKSFVAVCVLLFASSWVHAGCPSGLSAEACESYAIVEASFTQVSDDATDALIKAVISASSRAGELYKAILALLQQHAAAKANGRELTKEEATELLKDIQEEFNKAKNAQGEVVAKAMEAIAEAQREIIESLEEATVTQARMKRSLIEDEDFPLTKEALKEALAKAHQKVKEIVKTAVEKVNSGFEKVEGFFQRMMQKVASSKIYQDMKEKVQEILKKIEEEISGKTEKALEPSFDAAVEAADHALYGLELNDDIAKRSIQDAWSKVTNAVKQLGTKVYETAKKVLEQKKPEIMEALNKVGKILIDAGKQIVIELAGEVVKAALTS